MLALPTASRCLRYSVPNLTAAAQSSFQAAAAAVGYVQTNTAANLCLQLSCSAYALLFLQQVPADGTKEKHLP